LFDRISFEFVFNPYHFISPEMRKTQSINRKLDEALECEKKELDQQAKELDRRRVIE
jgi:hypothetical protein